MDLVETYREELRFARKPLARALLKGREGDVVRLHSPAGLREIEIVGIRYLG